IFDREALGDRNPFRNAYIRKQIVGLGPRIAAEIADHRTVEEAGWLQKPCRRDAGRGGSITAAVLGCSGRNDQRTIRRCPEVKVAIVPHDDVEWPAGCYFDDWRHSPVRQEPSQESSATQVPAL